MSEFLYYNGFLVCIVSIEVKIDTFHEHIHFYFKFTQGQQSSLKQFPRALYILILKIAETSLGYLTIVIDKL